MSLGLSMSDSILSFPKCAMTLKETLFFYLPDRLNARKWVCQGSEALLLMFGMSVCESVTVVPVKRRWLNDQGLRDSPLREFQWRGTSNAWAAEMGGWVDHMTSHCTCKVWHGYDRYIEEAKQHGGCNYRRIPNVLMHIIIRNWLIGY